ncbi:MAG: flagellar motor switch protein FliN [Phycisphaeraceae bacterium]|nr:flagellar motor switch protein FliN [Phycisphaeraceae bacterium]
MAEELSNSGEPAATPTGKPAENTPPVQPQQSVEVPQAAAPATPNSPGSGLSPGEAGGDAKPVDLPAFSGGTGNGAPASIDLLCDVALQVKIELGRTRMLVEDVLRLADGAVVELDKLAGDPVDIYVNERHVARGEVLVLNDNFCVRINEILDSSIEAKPPVKQAG